MVLQQNQIFANEINFTPKKGSTYYKGTTKTVTVVTDVSGSTVRVHKINIHRWNAGS